MVIQNTPLAPMDKGYHPELDDSPLINAELQNRYQSMVGSLNCVITLGRFDIQFSVTTMARYSHAPREGHLKAVIRIFGYLKNSIKPKLSLTLHCQIISNSHMMT